MLKLKTAHLFFFNILKLNIEIKKHRFQIWFYYVMKTSKKADLQCYYVFSCTRQACQQEEDWRSCRKVWSCCSRRQADRPECDHLGCQDGQPGGEAGPAADRHSAEQAAGNIKVSRILKAIF